MNCNFFCIFYTREHCIISSHIATLYDISIVFFSNMHQFLQTIRMQEIITFQIDGIITCCQPYYTRISCGCHTGILFVVYLDATIPDSIFITYIPTLVRTAVINKYQFPIRITLVYDTLNAVGQILFHLVAWNNY